MTYYDPDENGLPPHEPADSIELVTDNNLRRIDCICGPSPPDREVDIWEECPHCGEDIFTGTRMLTDEEYKQALAAYQKAKREWDQHGGMFFQKGPTIQRCTVTAADDSYCYEYVRGESGPWERVGMAWRTRINAR